MVIELGPLRILDMLLVTLFDNVISVCFVLLVMASLGMNVFFVTPPNVTLLVGAVFKLSCRALLVTPVTSSVFFI
jgi:hypothetical protein